MALQFVKDADVKYLLHICDIFLHLIYKLLRRILQVYAIILFKARSDLLYIKNFKELYYGDKKKSH